jgi:hypothetical protein
MGWTYNVTDDTAANKGPMIASVVIALTSLALTVVCTRVYVRILKVKAFGSDDWVMCATMVSLTLTLRNQLFYAHGLRRCKITVHVHRARVVSDNRQVAELRLGW